MSSRIVPLVLALVAVAVAAGLLVTGAVAAALPCGAPGAAPCIRILFVGNSYTFVNDLPAVFRDLAASNGRRVETGIQATGGATLADHASSPTDLAAIAGGWNDVVLQEQSQVPSAVGVREQAMFPPARTLVDAIRTAGAQPVLFETWGHADGYVEYGLDYARMQAAIDDAYRGLGAELGATVAPVGEAWLLAHGRFPGIELWEADASHPSIAGTYLAACVFYATLFGRSPVGAGYTAGLPEDPAHGLQVAAAQTVGVR